MIRSHVQCFSCEKTKISKNLVNVSRKTFMKHAYLILITEVFEENHKNQLPSNFVLMFDDWSLVSNHYMAVFASCNETDDKCKTALTTSSTFLYRP